MKQIKTVDAVGHVLCHDITRIVKDMEKDAVFRKGHVVREKDIPVLLSVGKEWLYVWEKQPGMLHENDAAEILYGICADRNMHPKPVKEGKIDIFAGEDGFFTVDVERLGSINSLGNMMIATRHSNSPVKRGDHLAGTRIIPLVIEQEKMDEAVRLAGGEPILCLHPYRHKKYAILTIGNEVYQERIQDAFTPVVREKLQEFDTEEMGHEIFADNDKAVTQAIGDYIDKGADMVICTGGMSVDPDDRTPLAIRNTGADVVAYGAPVLPGAMFMLAYYKGIPILGLPGCVMYAKRTIFDLMMPRVMADIRVAAQDLYALGNGGMCLNCPTCVFPNCAFGAGI